MHLMALTCPLETLAPSYWRMLLSVGDSIGRWASEEVTEGLGS